MTSRTAVPFEAMRPPEIVALGLDDPRAGAVLIGTDNGVDPSHGGEGIRSVMV